MTHIDYIPALVAGVAFMAPAFFLIAVFGSFCLGHKKRSAQHDKRK